VQSELVLTPPAQASVSKNEHDQEVNFGPENNNNINNAYVNSTDKRVAALHTNPHLGGGGLLPNLGGCKLHPIKAHDPGKVVATAKAPYNTALTRLLLDFNAVSSQISGAQNRQPSSNKNLKPQNVRQDSSVSGPSSSSKSSKQQLNDDHKRTHKEAETHKFSAGGSNKKNMNKGIEDILPVDPPEVAGSEAPVDEVIPEVIYLAPDDLEFVEWGSYLSATLSWKHSIIINSLRTLNWLGLTPIVEARGVLMVRGLRIMAASVFASYIAYLNQSQMHSILKCIKLASASVTAGLLAVVTGYETVNAPPLLGAGTPTMCVTESTTSSPPYNHHKYISRRSGHIYKYIRDALLFEFTGCTPDSHLCSRMLKKGAELAGAHYTGPFDYGVLADTVSSVACLLQVTLSRAVSSTVTIGAVPMVRWA